MAYEALKVRELFADEPVVIEPEIESVAQQDQYDLATALGIVREMETSAGRSAVFEEIKNKNPFYRLVDTLYSKADKRFLQPLLMFAYMIKCVVSLGPFTDEGAEVVTISNFANEHHTIERVVMLAPDVPLLRLSMERKNIFAFNQWAAAFAMLGSAKRIWPFLSALVNRHSFMPSARIASTLAFYMRFSQLFADRPSLNAAIIASNYSPESVGMAAAAHKHGKRLVYANHAPVPANGPVVPPVLADCAMFYGHNTTQTYERRSRCTADVALIGQPGLSREMEWREEVKTVGIFLTSGTKVETLKSLVATIRLDLPDAHVLIRQHPVTLLMTDFSDIGVDDPKTELTIGEPLDDQIAACDLVICGNSGVALNVLSGGRPVAYLSSLDGILFDSNGFVESRLVLSVPWWTDDIYERLRGFYQAAGWLGVMQSYDAAYGKDIKAVHADASEILKRYLQPQPSDPQPDTKLQDKAWPRHELKTRMVVR